MRPVQWILFPNKGIFAYNVIAIFFIMSNYNIVDVSIFIKIIFIFV